MKVCFIAPKAYSLFNPSANAAFGGAEVQISLLSKEMAKNKELEGACDCSGLWTGRVGGI